MPRALNGPILSVRPNSSGWLAVTTRASGYKAVISVYNDELTRLMDFRLSDAFVTDAVVSNDCKSLAVVSIGQENASFESTLSLYDLSSRQKDGVDYDLDPDTLVSMNLWGFTPSYLKECGERFPKFLDENLPKNPEKCEFFLPTVVSELITEGKADVKVLDNTDKWYGVTYKEDKEAVVTAFKELKAQGIYPNNF